MYVYYIYGISRPSLLVFIMYVITYMAYPGHIPTYRAMIPKLFPRNEVEMARGVKIE